MRAIVIRQYGGAENLAIEERPTPEPKAGEVLIEVKAFGLNQAEIYFRRGVWGKVAEITGIECVGLVKHDPNGQFSQREKVAAIVGGMGRSINGSYAEFTVVPSTNVVRIKSDLPWSELAAIPESYATAWVSLMGILSINKDQTLLVRGATSALGQAAVNIAANAGVRVIATTRNASRTSLLAEIGASEILTETGHLSEQVRDHHSEGIDAVLDIVGSTTVLDSLSMLRRNGHVCMVGFLGGGRPLSLEPIFQIPSGRHLSVFASAVVTGTPEFPLSEIPFQAIVDHVVAGTYKAKPARVFRFEEIQEAHRLMESNEANGKIIATI